jgi:NAD(P)-dependent dehydrogenase (short-subunit alcohol dehydrogenase family)
MGERLKGKVAIVTGAASGIGKASVELFRKHGATVVGADLVEGADERCDASDEPSIRGIIKQTIRQHGRLDIFFANAGMSGGMATLAEQTPEDWADILKLNLTGCALAIKHAAPAMVESGAKGSIICTASVAGLRSGAGGAAYSASKAGVINLVQNACQQLGGSGIRVNAICPGLIETGMTEAMYEVARSRGQGHRIGELNPLRRGGEPIEIAYAALFLASDESSYVDGHALVVDGGLSSSHPVARTFDFKMLKPR